MNRIAALAACVTDRRLNESADTTFCCTLINALRWSRPLVTITDVRYKLCYKINPEYSKDKIIKMEEITNHYQKCRCPSLKNLIKLSIF